MQSWQIYQQAKELLPAESLQRIYSRSSRLVDYWAANPRFAEHKKNPIDRIREMLAALCAAGAEDIAIEAIDILAGALGGRFEFKDDGARRDYAIRKKQSEAALVFGSMQREIAFRTAAGKMDTHTKALCYRFLVQFRCSCCAGRCGERSRREGQSGRKARAAFPRCWDATAGPSPTPG